MKLLVIGDLHWLNIWKKLIEENKPDKVVFLWDYVDSFIAPDSDIINNLREIISYKKANMDNTILLLWNHDVAYAFEWNWCSGNRPRIKFILKQIFSDNLSLFKICHVEWNYLFSHAWFHKEWEMEIYKDVKEYINSSYEDYNKLLNTHLIDTLFMCWIDRGWHDKYSWPLWADKKITEARWKLINYIQVVGHTHVKKIEDYGHIIYCDNLEYGDWVPLILNI